MDLIKLQGTQIFDGYRLWNDKVLILQKNGTVEALVNMDEAGDDVQQKEGIISPGFINCHCHLELSHLKGMIPEHTGLAGFVQQVVQKRNVPGDVILQAIEDAEDEMIKNGIVAVGDICNTTDTISQKEKANVYYHNFIEALGFNPSLAEKNFERFETAYQSFSEKINQKQVSITPHAPYSVSSLLWDKIIKHSGSKIMSIHNQETADENEWFESKTGGFVEMFKAMGLNTKSFVPSGKSSLQTCIEKFSLLQPLILVHSVHTNKDDIRFAEQLNKNLYWCLCPNANEYIGGVLPDVNIFIKNNCKIVLGTDSLASNHQLSILEEIKTIQKHFPQIPLEKMLRWATINGAKALQIDDKYGSFEKGKKPGVAIFNL